MGAARIRTATSGSENNASGAGGENGSAGNAAIDPAAAAAAASGEPAASGGEPATPAPAAPAPASGKGPGNNAAVNPTQLAPDDYERDAAGNLVLNDKGEPKKKRGRKPGQKNGTGQATPTVKTTAAVTPKQRVAVATEMLAAQFQILNTTLAFMTRFDDFKLTDAEAMQMADAASNVMAQFDYVPDPKISAVLGLVTTAGMIYGPRVYLYKQHRAKNKTAKVVARETQADERAVTNTTFYPNYGGLSG